ncbi:zinc-binding dehydrogenase [Nocardia aurea]|uniref:zinc-binding dehydrogenase n=1 Tax=Nocardia aurea TaxID=2144174 RepID=UPI003F4CEB71
MYAIRLHAFGPADNLRYETVPDPAPGPGQVRISVAAAGVHVVDTALRRGLPGPFPVPDLPTIPGREVAGTVDRVGADVDAALLGRSVVTHLGGAPGGYAALAVADVARLHDIPDGLDAAEAVAMIGTGRTTVGILQFADLGPRSVVAVTAAAGGIGTLLVQYAKNAGATVVGLAGGPDKVERVAANGADVAVDYLLPDWPERVRARLDGRGLTEVFDAVGGPTARAAIDLLDKGGLHLIYGYAGEGPNDIVFTEDELAERGDHLADGARAAHVAARRRRYPRARGTSTRAGRGGTAASGRAAVPALRRGGRAPGARNPCHDGESRARSLNTFVGCVIRRTACRIGRRAGRLRHRRPRADTVASARGLVNRYSSPTTA